jgi:hypothetical protein
MLCCTRVAAREGRFNVIEKLENNEQVLLMYLAGELPAGDQADVDRLLAIDAGLRQGLAELQACQAFVDEEIAKLDDASALPVSVDAAARQAGRVMRQRMAEPKVEVAAQSSALRARSWWWLYPTVAAASILIVAMLWLNRQTGPTRLGPEMPPMGDNGSDAGGQVAIQSPAPQTPASPRGTTPAPPAPAIASTLPPTPAQNSRDADDALLLDSLKSPVAMDDQRPSADDDSKRFALNDAMPQDELSQVLLNANGAQQ